MADIQLKLYTIPVRFSDETTAVARAEGNNAAWHCRCGEPAPLIGRCYFQFGHQCHTVCPTCGQSYRVHRDANKKADYVEELT